MPFVTTITLLPFQVVLAVLIAAYIVITGRPMAALGIYLSMALWTRTVFIGPVVHTYFWLAVIFAALVVFLHKGKLELALPKRGRWIVPWMVLWWLWIVLLIFLYKAEGSRGHYRNLIFTVCLPLPVIILAARDFSEVRAFAITFIATTLIGGWFALSMVHITIEYLLQDPLLKNSGVKQLGIVSYHYFARGYALSLLLSLVLFFESRRRRLNLLFVACAALCIYFLFLVGSRQSLNGALISGGLFVLWALLRVNLPRRQVLLVTVALAGIALYIYQTNPNLLLRADESELSDTIDLLGNRGDLWRRGWDTFVASPLWGNGFKFNLISHNIVIGTLSDQGVIGMMFLIGLLIFIGWLVYGLRDLGPDNPYLPWCLMLVCILIFTLIHSMASGSVLSVPYIYWATAILWLLTEQAHHRPSLQQAAPQSTARPATLVMSEV